MVNKNSQNKFRSYVEKMQIYLQTEYVGIVKEEPLQDVKPIQEVNNEPIKEPINDEILYEKPNLSRSTNQHEWTKDEWTNDILYPLDF